MVYPNTYDSFRVVSSGDLVIPSDHNDLAAAVKAIETRLGILPPFIRRVYNTTTDSTPTELFLDGSSLRISVPANTLIGFTAYITGYCSATGERIFILISGAISRDGSDNTTLVGSPIITEVSADSSVSGVWTANAVADDVNEALVIEVIGEISKTITWVCHITWTQNP